MWDRTGCYPRLSLSCIGSSEMDAKEYIECRLNPQIEWYNRRAGRHKWSYHILAALTGVLAASVAVTAATDVDKLFLAILGGVISSLTVLQTLLKSHEKWLGYRSASEDLKREKYFFKTKSGHYMGLRDQDIISTLVDRAESIISSEHQEWRSSNRNRNIDPDGQ